MLADGQVDGREHDHRALARAAEGVAERAQGVTKGFLYKMKSVYAHFPVNIIIDDDKHGVEIRKCVAPSDDVG